MRKPSLLIFLFFTAVVMCHAQVDTEFWFAPPEVSSGHGDRPIYLRISTLDKDATVTVRQPGRDNKTLATASVPANTTRTIDLSDEISNLETNMPASVMETGIQVMSSTPVTVYYEVGSAWNSEIFTLKGKNALGNKFVIPAQNFYDNSAQYSPTPYASFDIVATQNNTVVTVTPTKPVVGHVNEKVITIRLNAGETYSFKKTTTLAADNPVGTVVESNKPIAITIKDDSVINGQCRDLLGDQLVPVKVAGSEYVVLKGFLNNAEYIFITATENNTEVYVGGSTTPSAKLKAGEIYRHQINTQSTYVVSNKTIYVFHVTGFGCELGMALLPSINCKGSDQIGFSRTTSEFFGLNVLVRKEGIGHFTLNNAKDLIPPSIFSAVPGTNDKWYTAQLSFSTSQIPVGQASRISNDQYSFQVGIINGDAGTTCRYGYFSAFSTLFIGDDFSFCEGETATLDAGAGKESYLWNTGASTQKIDVQNSGTYWVKTEKQTCVLYDTIRVSKKQGRVDLGPDQQICTGKTLQIDGQDNFRWLWSTGATERYLTVNEPGTYSVSVTDLNGCPATDAIVVTPYHAVFNDDVFIEIKHVSVDTTNDAIVDLAWAIPAPENVVANKVRLYKRTLGSIEWELMNTMFADKITYADPGNDTDHNVYEYYATLLNYCDDEVKSSNIHHTIQLTGIADSVNDIISFHWNRYDGWPGDVQRYELWRKLDDEQGFKVVAVAAGDDNEMISVASDGFEHQYVVKAVGPSEEQQSWSNTIEFNFDHPVFVPNVFTPNGDAYNQYFQVKKIELYRNASLIVTDRWGKKVFEASGYRNTWSGEGLSSGVYYYVLDLKRKNKILKGPVSILK